MAFSIPLKPYDRVRETTTTSGTDTLTLAGTPSSNFSTFLSTAGESGLVSYVIEHRNGNEVEVGLGAVLAGPTLRRDVVLSGSNGDSKVSFTAGIKDVRFTVPATHVQTIPLTPQLFGAIGDGDSHPLSDVFGTLAAAQEVYSFATALTDELDYCGLQLAINTARYQWQTPASGFALGMTLSIPAGVYRVNKTVEIKEMFGFTLAGVNGMPQIRWYGNTSSPMFLLGNCDSCNMENLWLYHGSSSANSVLSAVDLQNGGNASTWSPTNWTFRHVHVGGFNNGTFQYCFRILGDGTGGDANNEHHRWERCNFRSYSEAGLLIQNATQAHQLVLTDCGIQGDNTGKCGIRNTGVITRLIVERCAGGSHTEMDFDFRNNVAHSVTIDQWNSENSARLCQLGTGIFGSPAQLRITNCRWESPSNIAIDGYIVRGWGPGPLTFVGNQILANVVGRQPKVKWAGEGSSLPEATLIFEGNTFQDQAQDYSADAYEVTNTTVRKAGNYYWDAGDGRYITFA